MRRERKRAAKTESGEGRMKLGFRIGVAAVGFLIVRTHRSAVGSEQTAQIIWASVAAQAGVRTRGTLPAQAQVAAWVRPGVARRKWAEPVLPVFGPVALLWAEMAEHSEMFFFIFQKFLIHI